MNPGPNQASTQTLRILNLEDNENDAELNAATLAGRWPRARLTCVRTRDEYTAALERGEIDVILSDYSLPGFSGHEALALAQQKSPHIPFLFVSGTIGEEVAIDALKRGATDYVLKHRLGRLVPAVERALREAEAREEYRRAEEAMRQSEHKYRELFECLGDAAFLADARTGKIIDTNRRAVECLEVPREEIVGRVQSQFLVPVEAMQPTPATPLAPSTEFELISPSGRRLRVDVRESPLNLYGRPLVLRLCREIETQPVAAVA